MKNKLIAILGSAVILVGAIGGVAFASGIDNNSKFNQPIAMNDGSIKASPLAAQNGDTKVQDLVETINANNSSLNENSNDINQTYKNMAKIMKDNGFEDGARYMQTGNYTAMADYMNKLSQEDYDKMISIMKDNGYGYMAQMMESIGKEGMVQMHNSMIGNGSNSNNMMRNFR
ncbi:hypothetical protein [Clostridium sp. 'White wine YQ']|uniref:hypothetical protein n=1 Tax=Clostridium sp. 'White wine YQ' TaxID=3027474 RepID=UPI00236607CD|nr:hypothetical protein [Clostridium sp. 'White wine YQ']MDD7795538.1 hypothetical protein [Clostridium sp. 'White wine YQ']